tara:strand:- start:320 stop:481 length:162 start_codon:yes stop_codon:yes gene_type:complete
VKAEDNDDLEAIKLYFGYSNKKAEQTLSILSSEQIRIIKDELFRGKENEHRVS